MTPERLRELAIDIAAQRANTALDNTHAMFVYLRIENLDDFAAATVAEVRDAAEQIAELVRGGQATVLFPQPLEGHGDGEPVTVDDETAEQRAPEGDGLVHMWAPDEGDNPTGYALCGAGAGKIANSTWQVDCPKCEQLRDEGAPSVAPHAAGDEADPLSQKLIDGINSNPLARRAFKRLAAAYEKGDIR